MEKGETARLYIIFTTAPSLGTKRVFILSFNSLYPFLLVRSMVWYELKTHLPIAVVQSLSLTLMTVS